jgi:hypothetical protein
MGRTVTPCAFRPDLGCCMNFPAAGRA